MSPFRFRSLFVAALAISGIASFPLPTSATPVDAREPFAPDRSFNDGQHLVDAFLGSTTNFTYLPRVGRRAVMNESDHLIVAALVPSMQGQTNGLNNIGLVRYRNDDSLVGWPTPTPAYAVPGNDHLIYPNDPNANIVDIKALKTRGSMNLVLVEKQFSANDRDVHVVVFDADGVFRSDVRAFGSSNNETGASLEAWQDDNDGQIYVATMANVYIGDLARPQFRRYRLEADGSLTALTLVQTLTPFPCDIKSCIAERSARSYADGRIFLGGAVRQAGDDFDFFVMAVDRDGNIDTSYGNMGPGAVGGGISVVAFDLPDSNRWDWLSGLDLFEYFQGSNTVHRLVATGDVARQCKPGMGVIVLDGTGQFTQGFGTGGKVVIGGSDAEPGVACNREPADFARAVSIRYQRIAIAGWSVFRPLCPIGQTCEDVVDGRLAILDPWTGAVRDFRTFPAPIGETRELHTGFHDIVAGGSDQGLFLIGDMRGLRPNGTGPLIQGVSTLKVTPDRIFGSGLQPLPIQ